MNRIAAELNWAPVRTKIFLASGQLVDIILDNKTRQGYARKRTLKPAGYFFLGGAK